MSIIKTNGSTPHTAHINSNPEADSGRASMASNNDQEQSSPTCHQRNTAHNRCNTRNV